MTKSSYFPKTKAGRLQWYEARIHDCMYLLLPESGASIDYAKGALSGLLSGIMACKPGFLPIDLKPFLPVVIGVKRYPNLGAYTFVINHN